MTTATVTLDESGAGSITIGDTVRPIRGTDLADARDRVKRELTARAEQAGQPVTMVCAEPAGTYWISVHPDGRMTAVEPAQQTMPAAPIAPAAARTPAPVHSAPTPPEQPAPPSPLSVAQIPAAPLNTSTPDAAPLRLVEQPPAPTDHVERVESESANELRPATRRERQADLRQQTLLDQITNEAPAKTGLRGVLNILGMHLAPSDSERAERADIAAVSGHWPGPRTVAVVNGKGGAAKTPTTILLSAVFARNGGAGVVSWDNNPTRGTLGWRTEQGPHDSTVLDLLPHVDHLLSPSAQAAEMAAFTHHQREDRYDVLRSRPEVLADANPGDAATFGRIHDVLTKYYRLVLIDSGNDESAASWKAMIHRADAIVVPTITRPEHAESARLLLAELAGADEHSAQLADEALVIVSQGSRGEPAPTELVNTFSGIARQAVGIPYDPAMAGRPLILDSLAPATRRAWLAAAAAVAAAL
ncbi:MinD/ParA family ATP-binding protein [Actinomyces succiniciruminis]|uniref:ATPase involved in chromosome partitioning n=1 Tax=Actinomyces succiniciruminis TaxID=1522002 RepID=A0A1L7RQ76_9ACTO|nr:ParA family protein [Actinomyces succiniciruminis]CED91303.1 ATPase involved in chromosome partitioning [Actinomyces succiniciruminis]